MNETVVITGANRGIGLALVREYLKRGCRVYGVCRRPSDELETSEAEVISGVDVTDGDSVAALPDRLKDVQIDVLFNNAGVLRRTDLGDIDYDAVLHQFEVNAIGPLRVTEALLGNLAPGSKVALITSRMGSMSDNTSGGGYGYRMSKAALNAAGVSLARDLNGRGIAVAVLHPGFVQTDMVGQAGDVTPEQAAERLVERVDDLTLETSGTFRHAKGEVLPW